MTAECKLRPLILATFDVTEVVEGSVTSWSDGSLSLDLAGLMKDVRQASPALADVNLRVVRPGESVRIANVLDAIVPDVKASDTSTTFPGTLGPLAPAGTGQTNRLRGVAVLSVCDWLAADLTTPDEYPDSFVDMAGPARSMTMWGDRIELVVTCTPKPGAAVGDVDRSVRRAALKVAADMAKATVDQEPSIEASFELARLASPALRGVAVILQVASEGPLLDTFFYGGALRGMVPAMVDYREILDGALISGAYDWPAVRNVTACYQDNALIRSLAAQHGRTLRFAGVVVAPGYLDSPFEKERAAMMSARLCHQMGADGVICTTFSSGNSHTDTMLTVRACEALGIGTVAILSETNGGLTDHLPAADSIISTGNTDEMVDPWIPDEVLGASEAMVGERVPLWSYLGACAQTGDLALTAVAT
jgi:glycine reductase complex component B subunit alpha and beta